MKEEALVMKEFPLDSRKQERIVVVPVPHRTACVRRARAQIYPRKCEENNPRGGTPFDDQKCRKRSDPGGGKSLSETSVFRRASVPILRVKRVYW